MFPSPKTKSAFLHVYRKSYKEVTAPNKKVMSEEKKLYVCPVPECHAMSLAGPFVMV